MTGLRTKESVARRHPTIHATTCTQSVLILILNSGITEEQHRRRYLGRSAASPDRATRGAQATLREHAVMHTSSSSSALGGRACQLTSDQTTHSTHRGCAAGVHPANPARCPQKTLIGPRVLVQMKPVDEGSLYQGAAHARQSAQEQAAPGAVKPEPQRQRSSRQWRVDASGVLRQWQCLTTCSSGGARG